jgi:ankyrin repeat protein
VYRACAYGVEPLAEKLVQEGADINCRNCFGYTPLLEACHRGFVNIVGYLVKGDVQNGMRADLGYIPSEEESMASPFVSSPAQAALGEAARSGYPRIVQVSLFRLLSSALVLTLMLLSFKYSMKTLLDAGAPRNQQNSIGWTPLHEACFYNRTEVVKALLLAGADAAIRTNSGALPYHLAGLQQIRTMLEDMGGPTAVPQQGDSVDMVAILSELTIAETTIVAGADGT